jgi:hypothetical protein
MYEIRRAKTPAAKLKIIQRLYKAWCKVPELRLGQLIQSTFKGDCFYTDDNKFIKCIEELVDIKLELPTVEHPDGL